MTQWSGGPNDQYRYGGPPQPPYQQPPYQGYPPPRKKGGVAVVAAVAAFVVVLALGAGGWLVWQRVGGGGGNAAETVDASSLNVLRKSPLTAGDVAKVDPAALFYAGFKATLTQPVMHITQESYTEREELEKGTPGYVWESGYDYRTKRWRMAWGSARPDDPITICKDGRSYDYSYYLKKWKANGDDDIMCARKSAYRYITDGLSTGGLTDAQADRWIQELQTDDKGFVNPARPTLAEVKGKQYLRLVVDYKPVKRADGLYYGGQLLTWSFKKTGLDPQTHPYNYNGGMGTGYHVVYYLDPGSLLPAYSEVEQTPTLDETGNPRADSDWSMVRVEYHLPGKMPEMRLSGRPDRPKLTWPRDKA